MLRNKGLIKENIRLKEEIEWKNTYIKKLEEEKEKYWKWYNNAGTEILQMQKADLERQIQELKEMNNKVEEI